jgi:hypothetical protein
MTTASEWLQAMVTPALSTSTSTGAPGLPGWLGVPDRLPDRRCMMAWQVGDSPVFFAGVAARTALADASGAAGLAGAVFAARARGSAMSPASRAVAISRCGTRRRGVLEGDESEGMRNRLQ